MRNFLLILIFSVITSNVLASGTWQSCNGVGPVGSAASVCQDLVKKYGTNYELSHTEVQDETTTVCYAKYKNEDGSYGSGSPDLVGSACKIAAEESSSDDQNSSGQNIQSGGTNTNASNNSEQKSSASKSSEQKSSSSKKVDVCGQVTSMFKETLASELPPNKTNGATIAVGAITSGDKVKSWVAGASSIIGKDGNLTVSNLGKPSTSKYDYYAQGIRINEVSNVRACNTNQQFVYPNNPARPLQGHAESKIIEDWFKNGAAKKDTLYLKIGGAKTKPCTNCDSLIKFVNNGGANCPKIKLCP